MKRLILFLIYVPVTFIISFVFGGAGHGSFAPMSIFYSWARLLLEYLILPEGSFFGTIAVLTFYLVLLFVTASLIMRSGNSYWYLALLVLHLMGIICSISAVEHGHLVTQKLIMESYVAAIPVSAGYYYIDYLMIKKEGKRI
jgi:hypothetical protein